MKPDFALSLSFEGIELLVRAAGGWRMAGRVDLKAADLKADLAALRQKAVDLGGAAFRTKLIIPRDQIRYLSVDTGHVSTADRIAQVRAALDGATPYAVEELVYDICVDGPMTHVAAVARDTLEEAESFAIEHRFQPVSFVAIPGDEAFLGEPFFGPTGYANTALASGERVEPDGIAVVVVGPVEESEKTDATEEDAAALIADTASVTAQDAPPAEPPVADTLAEAKDSAAPAEPPSPAVKTDVAPDPPMSEESVAEDPVPGFASRRASGAPALGGATKSTIAPHIEADDLEEVAPPPKQLFASLRAKEPPSDDSADEPKTTWAARFLSRRAAEPDAPSAPAPRPAPAAPAPRAEPPRVPPAPKPEPIAAFAAAQPASAGPGTAPLDLPDERERMTIFGMRDKGEVGGAPKHLGLILTAVLLIFLLGVAAWASVFLDEELSSWFDRKEPVVAAQVPALPQPDTDTDTEAEADTADRVAALDPAQPALSDTDAAVLDALRAEPEPAPDTLPPDQDTAEARYAVTGIWQKAPEPPEEPGLVTLEDLYLTSIDGAVDARDAVALPPADRFETDTALGQVISPAAPGSRFAFDDDGRVIPTPDGALSPDGFTVFLGRPPVVPPRTPDRVEEDAVADTPGSIALAALRPRVRPGDLLEQAERSQLGGLTLSELSGVRPKIRPSVEKQVEEEDETPTAQAVLASITPAKRPANIAQLVEQAARSAPEPTQVAAAAPATAAPAVAGPRIPSSASVARAATVNNAINLRRVNLIGVYGTPSNRRALVRLPNGRYKKVQVGDRLDGGRISAIGESELRYQKNGRNLTLSIPSG
ncbi:hypothetical protein [Aestuariivita boseongensis]|uniref:hypothetical protein n=1 Tax=Aestuariivita boseongensis TaxID=1470562 RepID=UPI000682D613|nr:hypothetical protein [Aestuariivita boseongensis]